MQKAAGTNGADTGIRAETESAQTTGEISPADRMVEELAYRILPVWLQAAFGILTLLTMVLVLNQQFNLHLFGVTLVENRYLFLLAVATLPLVFLAYPWHPKAARSTAWLGVDVALCLATMAALFWFSWKAETILGEGWEFSAPDMAKILGAVLWVLILEALRRTGGTAIFIIVTIVSLYPVVAGKLPSPLNGIDQPLTDTLAYHIVSAESAFGIPMRAFGEIVIGFSTANRVPRRSRKMVYRIKVLLDTRMDPLYEAVMECTEEAILNALCMATDMEGANGNFTPALPLDEVRSYFERRTL